jgi:hypothetical protein
MHTPGAQQVHQRYGRLHALQTLTNMQEGAQKCYALTVHEVRNDNTSGPRAPTSIIKH